MTPREWMDNPNLGGPHFASPTWDRWKALVSAMFGDPLTEQEAEVFRELTGRATLPTAPFEEVTIIAGRRSAKTRICATLGVILATYKDYRPHLSSGEIGIVALVAVSRDQARSLFNYCKGLFEDIPALRGEVTKMTETTIELGRRRVSIEITTGSFRTIRGRTLISAIFDELAFARSEESANPDFELVAAARPGLKTIPGAMMFKLSSPFARIGVMYDDHTSYYGVDGAPCLVIQAATWQLNPTITRESLNREFEADPAKAASEWSGTFRSDIESFVSRETIERSVIVEAYERPPIPRKPCYAFVDAASGAGKDSYVLAISCADNGVGILLHLSEVRPPFDPLEVIEQFCKTLRHYGITKVTGDRWAPGFQDAGFRKHGITYEPSKLNRSEIYLGILPYFGANKIELLDNKRLVNQFAGLVRRSSAAGRDTVDHGGAGTNDDASNACAGSLLLALTTVDVLTQFKAWLAPSVIEGVAQGLGFNQNPWADPNNYHYHHRMLK